MKICEKCGHEMFDEAVICVGCGCPVSSDKKHRFGSQQDDSFDQYVWNSTSTNIVSFLVLVLGLYLALFVNGYLGAFVCLIAEFVALMPNSRFQKAFKGVNWKLSKGELRYQAKSCKRSLKSRYLSFRISFVLMWLALIGILVSLIVGPVFSVDGIMTEAYLVQGKYQKAYMATDDEQTKKQICTENFLAYICYEELREESNKPQLLDGGFGEVTVSESVKYFSNDELSAIDNYGKLAEYVSMLKGKDVLKNTYYAVLELSYGSSYDMNKDTTYWLVAYDLDEEEYKVMYQWETLERNENDNDVISFYKYIAGKVMVSGPDLSEKAINRINRSYHAASSKQVTFELDLQ